jgi:hypothetical protein
VENLGKPVSIALRDVPKGVNARQVKPLLDRCAELEDLRVHDNQPWIGFDEVKRAISAYIEQDRKWKADNLRSRRAPRFPSLYSYDSKGRPHLSGPGSDSGRVRTYFDEKGNRVPFAKSLIPDWEPEWFAPTLGKSDEGGEGLIEDDDKQRWECFCGHVEKWNRGSRSSKNAARARMSKHLRKATEEVDRHREIHTNIFGQASV